MGLSSKLQQQTSTMKWISLLLAILHASEGLDSEIQLKKIDAPSEKEKCLNQSNKYKSIMQMAWKFNENC